MNFSERERNTKVPTWKKKNRYPREVFLGFLSSKLILSLYCGEFLCLLITEN